MAVATEQASAKNTKDTPEKVSAVGADAAPAFESAKVEGESSAHESSGAAAPERAEQTKERRTSPRAARPGVPRGSSRRGGRQGRRSERPRPEFDQKIVSIRRVTRVVAGGRRFSFSVAMVIGNKKGSVGVGIGKASDTALAIEKAIKNAKRNMVSLTLTKEHSILHDVSAKYNAARVEIRPAPGRGIVAGSAARTVLELAGITDVTAKILSRSRNKLNNARAALDALASLPSARARPS